MFQHLRSFDLNLVQRQTPDWLIYLRAQEAGFDGIVTRDWNQSAQAEEMEALRHTDLTVISWKRAIEDPIIEWGQLIAYMPVIKRLMERRGRAVIFLPQPQLTDRNVEKASERLRVMARESGIATEQIRQDARKAMIEALKDRGLEERLAPILLRRPHRLVVRTVLNYDGRPMALAEPLRFHDGRIGALLAAEPAATWPSSSGGRRGWPTPSAGSTAA